MVVLVIERPLLSPKGLIAVRAPATFCGAQLLSARQRTRASRIGQTKV